jgi:hypothetical protein
LLNFVSRFLNEINELTWGTLERGELFTSVKKDFQKLSDDLRSTQPDFEVGRTEGVTTDSSSRTAGEEVPVGSSVVPGDEPTGTLGFVKPVNWLDKFTLKKVRELIEEVALHELPSITPHPVHIRLARLFVGKWEGMCVTIFDIVEGRVKKRVEQHSQEYFKRFKSTTLPDRVTYTAFIRVGS